MKKKKILSHCLKLGKCSKGKKINQNTEKKILFFFKFIYKIDDFSVFSFII